MIDLLYFLAGLVGIWFGAHIVVDHALVIAKQLKISKLFIGLTILSIGTSLPEIFTHINASLKELSGMAASNIAIGTNIGSNIVQITLIIGILGLITKIKSSKSIQQRDGLVMLGSIVLLFLLGLDGVISQLDGALLFFLYLGYLLHLYTREEELSEIIAHKSKWTKKKFKNFTSHVVMILVGLGILQFAANTIVDITLNFSNTLGIEQSFFGLLIIGFATALPEFTTAVMGLLRKSSALSLGVLIGSNITNPMMALGIGAMITDNPISKGLITFDIPFWFVVSAGLLLIFQKNKKLTKLGAALMIGSYIVYALYKTYSVGII
jgi:cation:H+ antiporter